MTINLSNNGVTLQQNNLTILVPNDITKETANILSGIEDDIKTYSNTITPCTDMSTWNDELNRLIEIIQAISSGTNVNIFQHIPLARNGRFDNSSDILIAASNIIYQDLRNNTRPDIFSKRVLVLRLTRQYNTFNDFMDNKPVPNFRKLEVQLTHGTGLTPPVFDRNNIPAKPVNTTIPNGEKPGFLYEDKSGRKWLSLSGVEFAVMTNYLTPDGTLRSPSRPYVYSRREPYTYFWWTKKFENAVAGAKTMNELFKAMVTSANYPHKNCQVFPKEFTSEIGQVLDLSKTTHEIISEQWHPTDMTNAGFVSEQTDYILYPNNIAPKGFRSF